MRRLPLLLAVPAVLLAQARPTPEALTAHLNRASLLHVGFTQTRTLAALSRPLKSSGTLVVCKEKGVLWQVAKPLRLTIVVGPGGMVEVGADGRKKVQTSQEMPMVAQMGRIMKALLEGRWSALDDYFTVAAEGTRDRWTIVLSPRPQTAAFIKGVRVSGGAFLERIQVEEASRDRMELVFDHPREDLPLTEAEARLLTFD